MECIFHPQTEAQCKMFQQQIYCNCIQLYGVDRYQTSQIANKYNHTSSMMFGIISFFRQINDKQQSEKRFNIARTITLEKYNVYHACKQLLTCLTWVTFRSTCRVSNLYKKVQLVYKYTLILKKILFAIYIYTAALVQAIGEENFTLCI